MGFYFPENLKISTKNSLYSTFFGPNTEKHYKFYPDLFSIFVYLNQIVKG